MRINLYQNRTVQSVVLIDYIAKGRPNTLNLCMKNLTYPIPVVPTLKPTTILTTGLTTTNNPTSIPTTTYTSIETKVTSVKVDSTLTTSIATISKPFMETSVESTQLTVETTKIYSETTRIPNCPEDCYKSKVLLVPDPDLLLRFGLTNDFYKIKNNCTASCKFF